MQNNFLISQPSSNSPLPIRLLSGPILLLLFLLLLWPVSLHAQSTPPTPLPLAPDNTLVVVAGGQGAALWQTDSSEPTEQINAGARLVASKRSTDGQWLYVTTDTGTSGWAAADQLLVFYRLALPTEAVTITPNTPTPLPTATPENTTNSAAVSVATPAAMTATAMVSSPVSAAPVMTGDEPTARVSLATQRLNIRSGPGTSYAVIAKAAPAQQFTLLGRNEDQSWVEVLLTDAPGGFGWVAAQYLETDAALVVLDISTRINNAAPQPQSAAAASVAPAAPVQQTTAATGLSGNLVFQTSFGGPIYLYALGSGQLRQLTSGFDPALSPDGRQVVFTRDGGANGVYLINSDGSNEHKIFGERELLRSPKWSPDGQWIVFVRGDEFEDCRIFDEDGNCYRESAFPASNPRDYPLGKERIPKLARIDPNGKNYRDLATMEKAVAPDWNSNGIVYQSVAGLQITADQPDAVNRELFFEIQRQYHQDPDWQPGGGRVVFQQRQGSHWQIFAINPDGAGLTALTRPATALVDTMPSSVAPAWSPNGQSIVFLSNRTEDNSAGPWRLWVMNADGSNQRPLPVNLTFTYNYVTEQVVDWGP